MRAFRIFAILIITFFCVTSCGPVRQVLFREAYNDKFFEISLDSFRYKKENYRTLVGIFKDSANRHLTRYQIQETCGCISKSINPKNQWRLSTQLPVNVILTKEDLYAFKKFSEFPSIEKFCSKSLLDSAKGFIEIKKAKKPSR